MSNRNKLIHELLGRGCWHRFAEYRAIHGNDNCLNYCGSTRYSPNSINPDYINDPDIPHSTVVEAVTKAGEKFGIVRLREKIIADIYAGRKTQCVYFTIPASIIMNAIADMLEEREVNLSKRMDRLERLASDVNATVFYPIVHCGTIAIEFKDVGYELTSFRKTEDFLRWWKRGWRPVNHPVASAMTE